MKAEDLKNSILQLAMEGKLVPQNPNDEPTSVLLERIREEKEKLIKEKKISRNNKESFIFRKNGHYYEKIGKNGEPNCIDNEIPFVIPETWEYCRLNSIGNIVGGGTPKTKINEYWENGDIPWLTPADMKYVEGKYVSQGARNITNLGLEKSSAQLIPKNSIVYSSRAPIGYIAISNNKLSTNQGFKSLVLIDFNIVDYMYYCLISFTDEIKSRASGTTFKEISKTKFGETIIPIPPINEQKRIVKKIEELIPLITEYGNLRKKLDKLNSEFPHKIKSSILQEAIRGKLVPQDPNDEPASILLERIHDEKERLIKEKKIKRNKNESFIYKKNSHFYEIVGKKETNCIDDEIPFEIPSNWIWVRLQSLGEIIGGGTPKTKNSEYWEGGNIAWLTPADMKYINGKYVSRGKRDITKLGLEKSSAKLMPRNSVVYSTRAPIGYIAITNNELSTNQGFKSINPYDKNIVNYIYYVLIGLTKEIQSRASGTTFKEISGKKFGETLIPLPPLNEQKNIVKKIEKLFSII